MWTLVQVAIALVLSLLVGACGEEDKQTAQAVQWLETYSQTNPPNKEWQLTHAGADDKGQVVMDVLVPDQGQVDLIKSRTRVEQDHIVRMACPLKHAKIWTLLPEGRMLWVNLQEKMPDGSFQPITGASCKR